MPYDDPDTTDPMTLHGVMFDVDDAAPHREMAECFIEEYIRAGFDRRRLLHMFEVRGYAGPNMALHILGREAIEKLVDDCLARWGPRAPSAAQLATAAGGGLSLRVMEQEPLASNEYNDLPDPLSARRPDEHDFGTNESED